MKRIGLLSDTHGFLDPALLKHFEACDEVWHAGDIGNVAVANALEAFKPFRAVYGNIDGQPIRIRYPENQIFEVEGLKVLMTHIGGYPGRYTARVKGLLQKHRPGLYICGHSHILKVMPDPKLGLLHINPGACGKEGFHQIRTAVRFVIDNGVVGQLEVIELGKRGALTG
jgi:hypothetical protein